MNRTPMNRTPKIVTITLNPAIDQTLAIPNFSIEAVNRVEWSQFDPGGKGVNVASFLSQFGLPITVTGWMGRENAEVFETFFEQQHIDNCFVKLPGKTRINLKIIDRLQHQVTDINFPGQTPDLADLDHLYGIVDQLMLDHDWFVLAGSVPRTMPVDIFATLTRRLKSQGKKVILDTSGQSLRQALLANPDIIKPNVAELQEAFGQLLPDRAAVVQAARELLEQGIGCVVVSMGGEGALFIEAETALWAQPPQVEVASTVGAGDAMVCGLLVGKLRGWSLAESAKLATACSVGVISQIGRTLPPIAQIEAIAQQVTIEQLTLERSAWVTPVAVGV